MTTAQAHPFGGQVRIAVNFASVAGFAGLLFLPIWVSQISIDYHISVATGGFIAAVEFSAVAVASMAVSALLPHLRTKATLQAGLMIIIVGSLLPMFHQSLPIIVAGRAISGIGAGIVLAMTHAMAAQFRRPEAVFSGIYFWVILVGALLYPLAPKFSNQLGSSVVFCSIAAIAAVSAIVVSISMLPTRVSASTRTTLVKAFSAELLVAIAATFVFYIAEGALWTFVISLGIGAGVSPERVGFVMAIAISLGLIGPLVAGWIASRLGPTIPLTTALIILAVAAYILGTARGLTSYSIGIGLLNLVFIFVVIFSSSRLANLDSAGRAAGIIPALRAVGNAGGPWLGALILQLHGFAALGIAIAALYLSAAAMFGRYSFTSPKHEGYS